MSNNGSKSAEKPKFAMYWASSCGGCEIAVLNIGPKILDVDAAFDVVFWPVAMDAKYKDVEAMPDKSILLTLFNGGIRNAENEEIARLKQAPPEMREVTRAVNQFESSFYNRMERTGSFGGKADQLNAYYTATGTPDYFQEDLARYQALSPNDIQSAVRRFLPADRRVELSVVPAK